MTKKLLLFFAVFFICCFTTLTAQITISGVCNPAIAANEPYDTYSLSGTLNGRNRYIADQTLDCSSRITEAQCISYLEYRIEWSDGLWKLIGGAACQWFLSEECIDNPNSINSSGTLIATNDANTTLPPNGNWDSVNLTQCSISLSGGEDEVLSVDNYTHVNLNINVFPNPNSGEITVDFNQTLTDARLSLVNILGQTIFTKSILSSNKEKIVITNESGIYFLNLTLNDGREYYLKIIKK